MMKRLVRVSVFVSAVSMACMLAAPVDEVQMGDVHTQLQQRGEKLSTLADKMRMLNEQARAFHDHDQSSAPLRSRSGDGSAGITPSFTPEPTAPPEEEVMAAGHDDASHTPESRTPGTFDKELASAATKAGSEADQQHLEGIAQDAVNQLKQDLGAETVAALEQQRPGVFERIKSFLVDFLRLRFMLITSKARFMSTAFSDLRALDAFSDALEIDQEQNGITGVTAHVAEALFSSGMTQLMSDRLALCARLKVDMATANKHVQALSKTYPERAKMQAKLWGKLAKKVNIYEKGLRVAYNASRIGQVSPSIHAFVQDDAAGLITALSNITATATSEGFSPAVQAGLEQLHKVDSAQLAQRRAQITQDLQRLSDEMKSGRIAPEDMPYWRKAQKVLGAYDHAVESIMLVRTTDEQMPSLATIFVDIKTANIQEFITLLQGDSINVADLLERATGVLYGQDAAYISAHMAAAKEALAKIPTLRERSQDAFEVAYWTKLEKLLQGYVDVAGPLMAAKGVARKVEKAQAVAGAVKKKLGITKEVKPSVIDRVPDDSQGAAPSSGKATPEQMYMQTKSLAETLTVRNHLAELTQDKQRLFEQLVSRPADELEMLMTGVVADRAIAKDMQAGLATHQKVLGAQQYGELKVRVKNLQKWLEQYEDLIKLAIAHQKDPTSLITRAKLTRANLKKPAGSVSAATLSQL